MNSNKVRVVFDYDEKEDDDDDSCLVVIPNYERHERQKNKIQLLGCQYQTY